LSSDPLGRPQPSGVKLDEAQRFVGLIATGAWALVGLTAYTAIIFYMGWRVGVVEGAPLGGPVHDRVFRLSQSSAALISFPLPRCIPRIEGRLQ
jgi:hypothetical protein